MLSRIIDLQRRMSTHDKICLNHNALCLMKTGKKTEPIFDVLQRSKLKSWCCLPVAGVGLASDMTLCIKTHCVIILIQALGTKFC